MKNPPKFDIWSLYQKMLKCRCFEEMVSDLWFEGKISGEMHLGIGEEALMAALFSQLEMEDAIAVDHRGTAPFLLKGINPVTLLLEFLGHPKGLCKGRGGHMHLFSKEHLAASSGIVGSAGPAAAGFALAVKYNNLNNIAVAFFGEGAMNQGMLMESMNLAAVWKLPVLFICKNNGWAITTRSESVTGGNLQDRVHGLGIEGYDVDGLDVTATWTLLNEIIPKMRKKPKPYFINAHITHKEGHFLGDPLLRFYKTPKKFIHEIVGPLMKSVTKRQGTGMVKRAKSVTSILALVAKSHEQFKKAKDPLFLLQHQLRNEPNRLDSVKNAVELEMNSILAETVALFKGGAIE
jgi:acetoin:2,6-dichlorophenolindophenol oxidoreductase subunit alpha